MIIGFIKTDSQKLSFKDQKTEIMSFCVREHIVIDRWKEQTLDHIMAGDLIVCVELSFLGASI